MHTVRVERGDARGVMAEPPPGAALMMVEAEFVLQFRIVLFGVRSAFETGGGGRDRGRWAHESCWGCMPPIKGAVLEPARA